MSDPTPKKLTISRDEISAIYAQGEDAVIALVEALVEQFTTQIVMLEQRVESLENQVAKNSRNSSKPPSGDGFKPQPKSQRRKSERSSGGQKGHPGQTLEWSSEVDEVIVHSVEACEVCGSSLGEVAVESWDVRQVQGLPPIVLNVTEHRAEVKCCPGCQTLNRGAFPVGVNSVVQYGASLKSLMVYLLDYQLLPSARVEELLSDVFGCTLSEATLYTSRERCFDELEPIEDWIFEQVATADVIHCDETGMRVKGGLWWLHVASTDGFTFYFVHTKRGKAALEAMALLPNYEGISVHDGWKSYAQYECDHALCNAHHLRELEFICERYQQVWAEEMSILLRDIKQQVDDAKAQGQATLNPDLVQWFEERYQVLVSAGLAANSSPPSSPEVAKSRGRPKQSPAKNLLDRLQQHQSQVLAFMHDFRVPFDNNQAERDLRMMKLKQKISGGFRSVVGAQMFGRIRGYISTLKKQGLNVLDALKQVFLGNPTIPQPE
ncbi:IS66 family transposase [Leptolyngbya sp. AN03gr2]|uniref:IS66 family transposase n=1 Tax=unclassified Leptolyngbya TaxID=2650499 RepID=UPI003D31BFC7